MVSLESLDLPQLPLEDPAFAQNPWPRFAEARQKHPWLAKFAHGYIVHDYFAIKDILLMDDRMRNAHEFVVEVMGGKGTSWGRFVEEEILNRSGVSHKRLRDILAPTFTPRNANRHRKLMRQVAEDILDKWLPRREFDFEEFASYFPIGVLCSIIGAPLDAVPDIRWALETLVLSQSMDPKLLPDAQNAFGIMEAFAQKLVAERRQGKRLRDEEDLLDELLRVRDSGGLSEVELTDLLIVLFAAGYDTSKNVLTFMMKIMIDRPDDYVRCGEDFEFCCKVADESLRYYSPSTANRLTTDDILYRDVLIPKGVMLFFPLSVSGQDPAAFQSAAQFQPERNQENRHLAFGRGVHMCLGQYIARAELEEGWHVIARRIRKPRLNGPMGWRPFLGVWGIHGLPIKFDPPEDEEDQSESAPDGGLPACT